MTSPSVPGATGTSSSITDYLHACVLRTQGPAHGIKRIEAPWAPPGSDFTLLFEQATMALVREMPVFAAAWLIDSTFAKDTPLGLGCHAPAALRHATVNGAPPANDKTVTGFSNSEEEAVGLTGVEPFLVENSLKDNGGQYSKGDD